MIPILSMLTIGLLPSFLKKICYRHKGANIGKNVRFGWLSVIRSDSIDIGDDTKISPLNFIDVKKLKIGKRVEIHMLVAIRTGHLEIDDDAIIMEQVFIGGLITPESSLRIGKRVKVFPYSILNPTTAITIGDDSAVGFSNYIFTHGSWQPLLDGYPVTFGDVNIGKGVWLPPRVQIMAGVTIGDGATIGAGTLVNKDIPPRTLAAGVPVKILRTGDEYIRHYSFEEKDQLVRDILKEYARHLQYAGAAVSIVEESTSLRLDIDQKSARHRLFYAPKWTEIPEAGIAVSLSALSNETVLELNRKNRLWFDLEKRKTFYRRDPIWKDVRNFFSRYGVRFDADS
jgi:acetyltransferase-like isoleucine patch superfamily enzyme